MAVLQDPQHEAFAQALAAGKAPKLAYELAGFSTKSNRAMISSASRLRNRADVAHRILELQQDSAKLVHVDRAFIITKLRKTLAMAMGEMPKPRTVVVRSVIKGKKGTRTRAESKIIEVLEVDTMSANRAAELLGKEIGMFVDRSEVGAPGDFARLSDEELRERVRDIYAAAGVKTIDHDPGEHNSNTLPGSVQLALPHDPRQLDLIEAMANGD